jgi:hypothetical protein
MDPAIIDGYRLQLGDVIGRGRRILAALRAAPDDREALARARLWQHDCEPIVTALSGGSKRHWLSRAYSEALLVRGNGPALERADVGDIVNRIVAVLEQAGRTLDEARASDWRSADPPSPRRFDFVHDRELGPVLEAAYVESRDAFERREFARALATTCGILEAVITDALAHTQSGGAAAVAGLPFVDRIAAAEQSGLIKRACARLPAAALRYRDASPSLLDSSSHQTGDVERDARVAGQVLHVILRDLNPGR